MPDERVSSMAFNFSPKLQRLGRLTPGLWTTFKFNPKEQARIAASDALAVLLRHPVVTGATMAFRSAYRDLVLPLPDTWHDAWISLLIGTTSYLDALPIPLIAYRQRSANQIGIRRNRHRGKSCATVHGLRVLLYGTARSRLLEFANRFPGGKQKIHRLDETLLFLRARAALPETRWRRLPGALHELMTSRYHRYAHGMRSFFKDLIR